MARIEESVNQSQMKGILKTGYQTLDGDASITFTKYNRFVLPIDGYIFWIKDVVAAPLTVQGSLHYSTDQEQREDETIGINHVLLTTQEPIQDFNSIGSNSIYIGSYDEITFAFTGSGKYYTMADVHHYHGDAIYPAMRSQIISSVPFSIVPIATNSLPIWLSFNTLVPPVAFLPTLTGQIFPSFLITANLSPPYMAVDITETTALGSIPYLDATSNSSQLMKEKVKMTLYGLGNDAAIDVLNYVIQYVQSYENLGLLNSPRIIEEKRTQSELGILANKKTIEFEVSYYQNRAQNIARQLILSASCLVNNITADGILDANLNPFILNQSMIV